MQRVVLSIVFALGFVLASTAATLEIPGTHSNLQSALDASGSGDIISITTAGNYGGADFVGKTVTVRNDSVGAVIINTQCTFSGTGSAILENLVFDAAGVADPLLIQAGATQTITVRNCNVNGGPTGIISDVNAVNVTLNIEQSTISGGSNGLLFYSPGTVNISDSVFTGNSAYNLFAASATGTVNATRTKFSGGGPFGPQIHINAFNAAGLVNATFSNCLMVTPTNAYGNMQFDGGGNIVINHCTLITGTGASHHAYRSGSGGSLIVTNTLIDGPCFGAVYNGTSTYNLFTASTGGAYGGTTVAGTGDINPGAADFSGTGPEPYSIAPTSAAKDAADPASSLGDDILRNFRTDPRKDIGAYEQGAVPVELSDFGAE